jgi:integrase
MRLTRANLAKISLPPRKAELIVFDDALPGFGLRIRAGGKRVWIAQYRIGAKQRRVTLGPVQAIDPEDARRRAKEVLAHAHLGKDPQAEKAEARARAALTLASLIERYLSRHAATRLKPKTIAETKRYLTHHWRPLHPLPIHKVERQHVAMYLDGIATKNGMIAANRARAALSGLFTWAMREGLVETNPVLGTNHVVPERSRERVLLDEELAAVWRACGESDYGRIVRLLILTGQRREEVGGMAWDELDLDTGLWRIPAERTKNHRPHEIVLPSPALAVLRVIQRGTTRALVFGEGQGPFQGWSKARAALDRRLASSGHHLPTWRLHDVRRTVATRMAELGIQPHVIEAVLNHVSGHRAGVAGVYNRALYATEKRQALHLWAEHVTSLLQSAGKSVDQRSWDGEKAEFQFA